MPNIVFDNHVLIWGIKEQATLGQEDMIPAAKKLLQLARDENWNVILPTVILAEFLTPIPVSQQPMALNMITGLFKTVSFCPPSSGRFAKVWADRVEKGIVDQLKQDEVGKHDIKFDCLIVATAIQNNVDCIYSNDAGLARFAEGLVMVKKINSEPTQTTFL